MLDNNFTDISYTHKKRTAMQSDDIKKNNLNYYSLKKSDELLLKNFGGLSTEHTYNHKLGYKISEHMLVNMILDLDPKIKKVHSILQSYLEFNRNTKEKATTKIIYIIEDFRNSGMQSYVEFSETHKT